MRGFVRLAIGAVISVAMFGAYADNLAQVYQQALSSDPVFKKARADWLTAQEQLPLAMTGNGTPGTGLFPSIAASATFGKTYLTPDNSKATTYGVSITQPIFNLSTWESISAANYSVKASTAMYLAAAQDLMNRVATTYFEVLRANEKLNLTLAQRKQFLHEYNTAQEKYKVGIIAITSVYDAKAKYDQSVASAISDKNALQNSLEDLSAITGKNYKSLVGLKNEIPLVMPKPAKINQWVTIADKQNYQLQADLNNMLASHKNVAVAATAKVPSLNFVSSYSNGSTTYDQPVTPTPSQEQLQVGLNLNFPILRGGFDIVNTKQARYKYLSASDKLQIDHRQVVSGTRQAFLGVDSGISQIKAGKQAIVSAKNQVKATQEGYVVGTRTMVDVLNSLTSLTQAQQQYANDRYNYVESIFKLKKQAGTLSPSDINMINGWLDKPIDFAKEEAL